MVSDSLPTHYDQLRTSFLCDRLNYRRRLEFGPMGSTPVAGGMMLLKAMAASSAISVLANAN